MRIDRPSDRLASAPDRIAVIRPSRLPWMRTIAALRGFCGLWLATILSLAFQPQPMRAEPQAVRTANRPVSSVEDGEFAGDRIDRPSGDERPPKALVLKNGRIAEGRITQSAAGYVVDRPNGTMLIPFDRVIFEAADRRDAYRKLRSTMPADRAGSNVALARWCLSYNLLDEAESELREALRLEPYHDEARSMLRRLEEVRNPDRPLHRETPAIEPRTDDGFAPPAVESLGGFSRATAQEFVARVQPILVNKCGNASCHGGAAARGPEQFLLAPVRASGNRVFTERNLASALRQIDTADPDASPLLTAARGSHGGTASIFHGARAAEQLDALRAWVFAAAHERNVHRKTSATRPSFAHAAQSSESRADRAASAGRSGNESTTDDPPATEPTRPLIVPIGQTDHVDQALREQQPDPFSPDEFNRRR